MTKEWSEEGLNFDAVVPIKCIGDYGIQKVIKNPQTLTDEEDEAEDE